MKSKQTILLKLTGEILKITPENSIDGSMLRSIAQQIQQLSATHYFGIVIGGGNFFRGNKQGAALGLSPSVGHQIGMLATMMNGLMVKDIFEQHGVQSTLFSAIPSSEIGIPISNQNIKHAMQKGICAIFAGGTGNPFFTTDTTAILRGLQIEADCVWKGTNVDGIYSADPRISPDAHLIQRISYQEALTNNLKILDATAFVLAKEHTLRIRVFNIFKDNALIHASQNPQLGSIVE
jgi:uridylate kinase